MTSTPIISARIMRLTALLPPPPTPITRISAKFSESDRSGIRDPPVALRQMFVVRSGPPEIGRALARNGAGSDAMQYTPSPAFLGPQPHTETTLSRRGYERSFAVSRENVRIRKQSGGTW